MILLLIQCVHYYLKCKCAVLSAFFSTHTHTKKNPFDVMRCNEAKNCIFAITMIVPPNKINIEEKKTFFVVVVVIMYIPWKRANEHSSGLYILNLTPYFLCLLIPFFIITSFFKRFFFLLFRRRQIDTERENCRDWRWNWSSELHICSGYCTHTSKDLNEWVKR